VTRTDATARAIMRGAAGAAHVAYDTLFDPAPFDPHYAAPAMRAS